MKNNLQNVCLRDEIFIFASEFSETQKKIFLTNNNLTNK